MAFLVSGCFQFLLLLSIPRVARSLRTKRILASDLMLVTKPEPSGSGFPKYASLRTHSPGLSLDLDVPRGASFLRIYGYNRTAASLYSVCVDCNEDYESYWTVDAQNASNSSSAPGCLFSMALEGHSDHSIRLHNLYDSRFGAYGEINLSFVEYVFEEHGSQLLPTQTTDICDNHLRWSGHRIMLLHQRNNSPSSSSPTDSEDLTGEMNTMIGLIATLIAIVVAIFFIVVFYALRLRSNRKLQRQHDLENVKNDLPIDSGKSGSQTIFSRGETVTQPDKEKEGLPAEGYITDRMIATQNIDPTSSSFSTHTKTDATKLDPNWNVNADTSTSASATSRRTQRWTRPPTSPPKEPVPPLPTTPTTTPIHYMHTKRGGRSSNLINALPRLSPVQSQWQQGHYTQPASEEGSQVARNYKDAQDSGGHGHVHNNSGGSPTSHESRLPYNAQPPSKQQLTLSLATFESPVRSKPSTNHSQHTNRHPRSDNNKLAATSRDSLSRSSDAIPLQSSRVTANPALKRPRSAEDVRISTQSQTHVLQVFKSSPELEHLEALNDIHSTDSPRVRDRPSRHSRLPAQNTSSAPQTSRKKRESVRSQLNWKPQQMGLRLKVPLGPNVDSPPTPEHEGSIPPSSAIADSVDSQATKVRIDQRYIQESKSTTAGNVDGQVPTKGAQRPPLPQPPSYEQVVPMYPSALLTTTSPPRKRALPKPPS